MAEWEKIVEIMIYRESQTGKYIFEDVLLKRTYPLFFDLFPDLFVNTALNIWYNKIDVLIDVLEILTKEGRLTLLKRMTSSPDHESAVIGHHFSKVFRAKSLKNAISHMNALKKTFPNVYEWAFKLISEQSTCKFQYGNVNDKESVSELVEVTNTRLNFSDLRMKTVFIHESLMIGVQTSDKTYLNAYDMYTKKCIWTIPLIMVNKKTDLLVLDFPKIKQVGDYITFQFIGEKKLHLIHAATGKFAYSLKLPVPSGNNFECLHMSPEGFIYQTMNDGPNRILIGGKVLAENWEYSFELKVPNGYLRPFSTHCGFQSFDKLIVCSPTGHTVTIDGCVEAQVKGNKLYAIENDPDSKDKRVLTVRTLKLDEEVISAIETSITINLRKISIGSISENGQLVLFSKNISDASPIFVDLESRKVTYSTYKFYSHEEHRVNPVTGELWTFDQKSKSIWKVSATSQTCMGYLKYSRGTSFLHVDEDDHLYYNITKKPSSLSDGKKVLPGLL